MLCREPAVAGMFYPANPVELETTVKRFIENATHVSIAPKAIIAPHAGYIYSGPVAASIYKQLASLRDQIKKVVLLGPSHRVAFRGLAVCSAQFYRTPLGDITIDRQSVEKISRLPQVTLLDEAHLSEHSLEVHLPFLQTVLEQFTLVPIVVGDTSTDEVAEVVELLWGDTSTLIVVSSDLSHYHSYDIARRLDSETTTAIEKFDINNIGSEDACGKNPIRGLLSVAKQRNLKVKTLDVRNSGDTAGSKDQVVGYGAYAFYQ